MDEARLPDTRRAKQREQVTGLLVVGALERIGEEAELTFAVDQWRVVSSVRPRLL